jgi:hypothetical protein
MKVVNISSTKLPITVGFINPNGEDIFITIPHGSYVFSKSNDFTKTLIVQERKGNISISSEELPDGLEYYKIYPSESKDTLIQKIIDGIEDGIEYVKNIFVKSEENKEDSLDVERAEFIAYNSKELEVEIVPEIKEVVLENTTLEKEPEVVKNDGIISEHIQQKSEEVIGEEPAISKDDEYTEELSEENTENQESDSEHLDSTEVKNKGGRPKGVKNKSKRGRPKAKKPVGRPKKKKKPSKDKGQSEESNKDSQ